MTLEAEQEFFMLFGETFAFTSRGLNVVAQISSIVAAMLWIPSQVSSNAEGIYALYLKRTVMKVKEYG